MSNHLPDYSKGYPKQHHYNQYKRDHNLVKRGYQDSVCLEQLASRLGQRDSHKKGSWHPAHNSVPKARKDRSPININSNC